eukprot:1158139-Pelagomonas_calceolata.AAC.7
MSEHGEAGRLAVSRLDRRTIPSVACYMATHELCFRVVRPSSTLNSSKSVETSVASLDRDACGWERTWDDKDEHIGQAWYLST